MQGHIQQQPVCPRMMDHGHVSQQFWWRNFLKVFRGQIFFKYFSQRFLFREFWVVIFLQIFFGKDFFWNLFERVLFKVWQEVSLVNMFSEIFQQKFLLPTFWQGLSLYRCFGEFVQIVLVVVFLQKYLVNTFFGI